MNINKHIALAAVKYDNTHNDAVLQHIWNNRDTRQFFSIKITNVAKSGDRRSMEISIPYQGRILNITHIVADINEAKIKNGLMVVNGGGMDMGFSVLYDLYRELAYKAIKEDTMRFKAVNSYNLSC